MRHALILANLRRNLLMRTAYSFVLPQHHSAAGAVAERPRRPETQQLMQAHRIGNLQAAHVEDNWNRVVADVSSRLSNCSIEDYSTALEHAARLAKYPSTPHVGDYFRSRPKPQDPDSYLPVVRCYQTKNGDALEGFGRTDLSQ